MTTISSDERNRLIDVCIVYISRYNGSDGNGPFNGLGCHYCVLSILKRAPKQEQKWKKRKKNLLDERFDSTFSSCGCCCWYCAEWILSHYVSSISTGYMLKYICNMFPSPHRRLHNKLHSFFVPRFSPFSILFHLISFVCIYWFGFYF